MCGCSGESSLLGAVEKATVEAEKHGDRSSEKLSALVAEAKTMIEQAKTEQAERARAVAEQAAAAAAVKAAAEAAEAAERLQVEAQLAALTLRMETRRTEGAADALRAQQMQARLGSSVVPPAAPEETMCVVCMDAPKNRVVLPCMHMCVCEACAQLLRDRCPVCRGPIERIAQLFT
jgi:hypothetical protein